MRRLLLPSLVAALTLTLSGDLSAQASVFLGGGLTIPTGEYSDYAKTGWNGFGGVLFAVGEAGLAVGAEGFFGSNSHDYEGDKTNLYGGMGLVSYSIDTGSSAAPFVFGGVGYMTHSYKSDDFPDDEGSASGLAAGFGGGVSFPLGGVNGILAGSFVSGFGDIDGTHLVGINAAVQIPFGS